MPRGWQLELLRLAAVLAPAAVLGLLVDALPLALLVACGAYAAWHLFQLVRLSARVAANHKLQPPFPRGLWQGLHESVQHLQVRTRKRKRRLAGFLTRFRDAAAALPDAAVVLGRQWEIEWCNPAAQQLLGIRWPQAAGRDLLLEVRHPTLEEYLTTGDFVRPFEMAAPANSSKILSLRVTPFGRKHQHLLVARDITRVYHLDQARRDFVANVSHELRTPLTVVSGFVETLSEAADECPQWGRSLELMAQQTRRMQLIIDDLLTLSRLEMDSRAPERDPVDVPSMLDAIRDEAHALSRTSGHILRLETDRTLWLRGDAAELRSAFSNLVFNAIRHTPVRTEVSVRWAATAGGARLTVQDTGAGIPARHLPRLTERFYRVDAGRSRESGGTGLGLAIVKHVITRHGGELQIASEVGKGSTFSAQFPAELLAAPERGPLEPARAVEGPGG